VQQPINSRFNRSGAHSNQPSERRRDEMKIAHRVSPLRKPTRRLPRRASLKEKRLYGYFGHGPCIARHCHAGIAPLDAIRSILMRASADRIEPSHETAGGGTQRSLRLCSAIQSQRRAAASRRKGTGHMSLPLVTPTTHHPRRRAFQREPHSNKPFPTFSEMAYWMPQRLRSMAM
jgi:hypothetical protein